MSVTIEKLEVSYHKEEEQYLKVAYQINVSEQVVIQEMRLFLDNQLFWAEGSEEGRTVAPGIYGDTIHPVISTPFNFSLSGHNVKFQVLGDFGTTSKDTHFYTMVETVALAGIGIAGISIGAIVIYYLARK